MIRIIIAFEDPHQLRQAAGMVPYLAHWIGMGQWATRNTGITLYVPKTAFVFSIAMLIKSMAILVRGRAYWSAAHNQFVISPLPRTGADFSGARSVVSQTHKIHDHPLMKKMALSIEIDGNPQAVCLACAEKIADSNGFKSLFFIANAYRVCDADTVCACGQQMDSPAARAAADRVADYLQQTNREPA